MEKMPQSSNENLEERHLSEEQELFLRKALPELEAIGAEKDWQNLDVGALSQLIEGLREHDMLPDSPEKPDQSDGLAAQLVRLKTQVEYLQKGTEPPPHLHMGSWNYDSFRQGLQKWTEEHRTWLQGAF